MSEFKIHSITRSARKSISMSLNSEGNAVIKAPHFMPESSIRCFVKSKAKWIEERRRRIIANAHLLAPVKIHDGAHVKYMGKTITVSFTNGAKAQFNDGILIPEKYRASAAKHAEKTLRSQALKIFTERVLLYSRVSGLVPGSIKISSARKRWGSCSGKNTISFCWRLIAAPVEMIDYVVVHELCHIKHKNHSARYWNMVGSIMSDYKERDKWLKENAHILKISFM